MKSLAGVASGALTWSGHSDGLPPPNDPGEETDAEKTSPWMNIGLIVYRPTAARLAVLRTALAGDLQHPATLWVLSCVGCRYYPLASRLEELLCRADKDRAAAIPSQLALDGLSDTRELPAASLPVLAQLSQMSFGDAVDLSHCSKPRVCDHVAARLLSYPHHFNRTWNPSQVYEADSFLAEPPEQRDRDLLALSASFRSMVQKYLKQLPGITPQR